VIGIINYGLGNLHAFLDCYRILGIPVVEVTSSEQLLTCNKLVLPGVGSFDTAMQRLNYSGLREPLDDFVRSGNVEVLGVCVGLQMLFTQSDEGSETGLAWLAGEVKKLHTDSAKATRIPHIGWNSLSLEQESPLFDQIQNPSFYFLHSYCVAPENVNITLATCDYGMTFAAAVNSQNIWGVQFHPEKSHTSGLKLLENFARL
jgi:glutamine amidotransferase